MRKISPNTAIALVALFFSLAGTGLAARSYIISSLSQIAPKVRAQLRGAHGSEGIQGKLGEQGLRGLGGPAGPAGQDGARGPFGPTGLQGYAGRDGENGARGEPGCGQAPDAAWESGVAYLQGCTRYTMQGSQWRKVIDGGKPYLCVRGHEHDGEQGVYCRSTKSPSEQIAENPATAEWEAAP